MASVLEEDRKEAPKEAALNEELRRKLQEFIDGEVGGSWVLTELKNSTHELFKDSTKNDLKQLSTHFDEFADIVIRRFKELVIRKGSCVPLSWARPACESYLESCIKMLREHFQREVRISIGEIMREFNAWDAPTDLSQS